MEESLALFEDMRKGKFDEGEVSIHMLKSQSTGTSTNGHSLPYNGQEHIEIVHFRRPCSRHLSVPDNRQLLVHWGLIVMQKKLPAGPASSEADASRGWGRDYLG